jgi:acetyl-CoA carboxylase biotin carboxyl carrier protein
MGIEVVAPMSGKIVSVGIKVGDRVEAEDEVLTMEAMKMEMPVVAPEGGVVAEMLISAGDTVEANQVIAIID